MQIPFDPNLIYLDYAATCPVDPRVVEVMQPYFSTKFGNSSSIHSLGQESKQAIETARSSIAQTIGVDASELIFTSSATESNNLVLKGLLLANQQKRTKIITTSIEHDSAHNSVLWLQKLGIEGFEVVSIPVDGDGFINVRQLEKEIDTDTLLISIIFGNNEIGTIQPLDQIAAICKKNEVLLHIDASQSFGRVPIHVKEMNFDLMTISSHKIYGPKGVAGLYIRKGIRMEPLFHGGGQEKGLRSSTTNVPAIVGFAKAVEIAMHEMNSEMPRLTKLRDQLIQGTLEQIPDAYLTGHPSQRLPNHASFRFDYVEGESLVTMLDMEGIAASTGSACSSKSLEPSHVLTAVGLKPEQAHGSLRLTLGRWTTSQDIEKAFGYIATCC